MEWTELTRREQQIVRYIARGLTIKDVAQEISLNFRAVAFQVYKLMEKTGSKSRVDLSLWVAANDPNRIGQMGTSGKSELHE
jgi:DNA-binding NarL/FixJ family response regulator